MSNTLINRINQRISELGTNPQAVSKKATGANDTVRKILDGTTRSPRLDTLTKIAEALQTTTEWLQGADLAATAPTTFSSVDLNAELPSRYSMPNDVPVMGTAAGSHAKGAFQMTPGPVDYVRRPPALANVKGLYSLYVEGTSMEPQFFPGDLIYINPHKPPRVGDAVVIECKHNEADGHEGTIGVYLKRNENFVTIKKHNPPAEIQIARSTITSTHKILTLNEIFGV
ncbi:LexA family transcriptional regulator [Agrobacterium rosae]|uniref:LexA family transcriptional regulator n=1 Tax=Agrobacterium rosae TaxID=1972867 RepID=UPI00122FB312|nr:S24 family peptidase [Agrobacterium rosae]KAA3510123.1 XRE family transcriptional regulator [Agrobacterium rosae]KAA3514932.1 XRE family transcriptional regulator [Agrobacterium rosae]MQB50744.1 XRE family transcriptional regulator [Agrobacterium rosae]